MTSPEEQDNLELLFDKKNVNNGSNMQDGVPKDAPQAHLSHLHQLIGVCQILT